VTNTLYIYRARVFAMINVTYKILSSITSRNRDQIHFAFQLPDSERLMTLVDKRESKFIVS